MRLIFLGDIVGRAGRTAVLNILPRLQRRYAPDFLIINGENAAGGFGITEAIFDELIDAGADVITTGNHVWDQRETLGYIDRKPNLLRPINYPPGTPGKGAGLFQGRNGHQVLVINAMGRVFMNDLDCPFRAVDQQVEQCKLGEHADAIVLDFHAEATSEKQAMGHYLDGRASLVVGTHTHAPTSDERVLPGGTGYMSDAGMCGDYDSVIGMEKEEPMQRMISRVPKSRWEPATGEATVCGVAVDIDNASGHANEIAALRFGGTLSSSEPLFWVE